MIGLKVIQHADWFEGLGFRDLSTFTPPPPLKTEPRNPKTSKPYNPAKQKCAHTPGADPHPLSPKTEERATESALRLKENTGFRVYEFRVSGFRVTGSGFGSRG